MPKRIQRQRTEGWKMPPNTVYVGRPTVFGNPWLLKEAIESELFEKGHEAQVCVDCFDVWVTDESTRGGNTEYPRYNAQWPQLQELLAALPLLRGKDLACWCKVGEPCHADVLLRLANHDRGGK